MKEEMQKKKKKKKKPLPLIIVISLFCIINSITLFLTKFFLTVKLSVTYMYLQNDLIRLGFVCGGSALVWRSRLVPTKCILINNYLCLIQNFTRMISQRTEIGACCLLSNEVKGMVQVLCVWVHRLFGGVVWVPTKCILIDNYLCLIQNSMRMILQRTEIGACCLLPNEVKGKVDYYMY